MKGVLVFTENGLEFWSIKEAQDFGLEVTDEMIVEMK